MDTFEINELAAKLCDACQAIGRSWVATITTDADEGCPYAVVSISEPLARGRAKKLAEITIRANSDDDSKAMAESLIWGSASTVRGVVASVGMEVA